VFEVLDPLLIGGERSPLIPFRLIEQSLILLLQATLAKAIRFGQAFVEYLLFPRKLGLVPAHPSHDQLLVVKAGLLTGRPSLLLP